MDSLFPPTPFYALLAIASGVVSKITADDARIPTSSRRGSREQWVLHGPLFAVWAHIIGYMVWRLIVMNLQLDQFQRTNLIIHTVLLILVGAASSWIYFRQISMLCADSKTL